MIVGLVEKNMNIFSQAKMKEDRQEKVKDLVPFSPLSRPNA